MITVSFFKRWQEKHHDGRTCAGLFECGDSCITVEGGCLDAMRRTEVVGELKLEKRLGDVRILYWLTRCTVSRILLLGFFQLMSALESSRLTAFVKKQNHHYDESSVKNKCAAGCAVAILHFVLRRSERVVTNVDRHTIEFHMCALGVRARLFAVF
jgi:hypothetical protein